MWGEEQRSCRGIFPFCSHPGLREGGRTGVAVLAPPARGCVPAPGRAACPGTPMPLFFGQRLPCAVHGRQFNEIISKSSETGGKCPNTFFSAELCCFSGFTSLAWQAFAGRGEKCSLRIKRLLYVIFTEDNSDEDRAVCRGACTNVCTEKT